MIRPVVGGGGVRLNVHLYGRLGAPPILFVHGWSQSHLTWVKQVRSDLADDHQLVAFDLRGHGYSEAPRDPAAYDNGDLWAGDLAAVIEQLGLQAPTVVAWSFGGFVLADYVRVYGDVRLGAVNLVGTSVTLGDDSLLGSGFTDYFDDAIGADLERAIAAMRGFIRACTARPLPLEEAELMLAYNMLAAPHVRSSVASSRKVDFSDHFAKLSVPLLISHGTEDSIALVKAVEGFRRACPDAAVSIYDGVGHAPFMEDTQRFNSELRALSARAQR